MHAPRDMHLRQAALDAEVQAKVAQDELKEDPGDGLAVGVAARSD